MISAIMQTTLKKRFVVYVPQIMIDQIDKASKENGMSRSEVMRIVIEDFFKEGEENEQ